MYSPETLDLPNSRVSQLPSAFTRRKWCGKRGKKRGKESAGNNRTEQNRTEQNRTEQNRTEQNRTEQNRT
jgi:hypothetical protein